MELIRFSERSELLQLMIKKKTNKQTNNKNKANKETKKKPEN